MIKKPIALVLDIDPDHCQLTLTEACE
jgi:hypothetical protein